MKKPFEQLEAKEVTVKMPYPGSVISVNHYLGRRKDGGQYVKAEAEAWMNMLGWQIKTHYIESWRLPLHVTCSGVFENERSAPDLSNLSKCILDAIQYATWINDKNMRWHDGKRVINPLLEPELTITIREGE